MAEWNPTSGIVCIDMPAPPDGMEICFPGGFCLSHVWSGINSIPRGADMPLQFMGQAGPAMAFLSPLFSVLDTAIAIFKCVKAVPDSILKLDPGALFECLPELVELVNNLLSMIPQLSMPRMVRQILIGIAQLLQGLASDYQYTIAQYQKVLDQLDRAADLNDVKLNDFLVCRQNTLTQQSMSTTAALGGIGRIILLANIFIGLFGGDVAIPCFSDSIDASDLGGLQTQIDLMLEIATYLNQLANLIPDPQYIVTQTIGAQTC